VVVRVEKPDLRGKELTRKVAYEKTPDAREHSKSPSKLLDMGVRVIRACQLTTASIRVCTG
jgi:hypothetical protein